MLILLPCLAAICAYALTPVVRRYALKRALYDHPNHRSLHSSPTPRGGGIVIVAATLAYVIYALVTGAIERRVGIAILGGGSITALVGAIDDVRSLSAESRLAAHFAAATWTVWWLGGLDSLDLGFTVAHLGIAGGIASVFLLVWAINLYNFMDGIDGLASVEALFLAGGGASLLIARGNTEAAAVALVVFGAALGFLRWNWQPARIFMGDACSGFLGFIFGAIAIWSENSHAVPLVAWLILASAFFMDSSITIARRIRAGIWRHAHRSHAYQRAVIAGASHSQVVMGVAAVNVVLVILAAITVIQPTLLLAAAAASIAFTTVVYVLVGRKQPFVIERR